jgi:hypothetical protein
MAPLDLLSDRFEGIAPSTQVQALMMTDLSSYRIEGAADRAEALQLIRRRIFVSSWHLSAHESDNLWHKYCPNDGIVIRTTYRKLRDSVGGLPIGMVEYADFSSFRQPYDPILGAWLKRANFAAEQEVRVGLYMGWLPNLQPEQLGRRTYGMPIEWPIETVIERVVVYPGADFGYIEAVTEAVNRLAPEFSEHIVAYSSLASSPPY